MVIASDWVQVESVLLMSDGKGLGFGIVGGKSTGVVVKSLVSGGIADRVSLFFRTKSSFNRFFVKFVGPKNESW